MREQKIASMFELWYSLDGEEGRIFDEDRKVRIIALKGLKYDS